MDPPKTIRNHKNEMLDGQGNANGYRQYARSLNEKRKQRRKIICKVINTWLSADAVVSLFLKNYSRKSRTLVIHYNSCHVFSVTIEQI